MRKRLRRLCAAALAAAAVLTLSACSGRTISEADAAVLVEGNLDQLYRGRISDDYGELTGVTPEQAEAVYQASLREEAACFCRYFQIEAPSEQTTARLTELLGEACAQSAYRLGTVTREDKDTCTVAVDIFSSDVISRTADALKDSLEAFYEKYAGMDPAAMDADTFRRYDDDWAQAVLSVFNTQLQAAVNYDEPVTAAIRVVRDGNNAWTVNADDLRAVDEAMILYP